MLSFLGTILALLLTREEKMVNLHFINANSMKVFPFKVLKSDNSTLLFQVDRGENLYDKFHQHDEIQITFIENGEGRLLVGDSIHPFKAGDIFMIGENLPHVFYLNEECVEDSVVKSLYFSKELLGRDILSFTEFSDLIAMFEDAKSGISFLENTDRIEYVFSKIEKASGLGRIVCFFDLLQTLKNSEYTKLATFVYSNEYSDMEGKRMSNVMNYTIANFAKNITLDAIAEKANMNKNAFCRYFKQRTNKSFFEFLIEIRIENACRILQQDQEATIVEVAERCGFNNVSNFNRKFREIKCTSPHNYRKLAQKQYKKQYMKMVG